MEPQLGYWRWKIYRWNDVPNPFRGRHDLAMEWLRRTSSSGTGMSEMRSLLERAGMGSRPDDNHVLEEVAARLSSGEFHIWAESGHPFHTPEFKVVPADPAAGAQEALAAMTESPAAAAAAAAASPAPAATPADTPPPPLSQPSTESTLAQNADAAVIASSLQQAAQTGTAFCEECTKVKPAPAKTPHKATVSPQPAEFGDADTVDAAATARLMKRAAQEGAPYCEECEKRKKQRSEAAPAATGSS